MGTSVSRGSALGQTIEASEITDGAVTEAKLSSGLLNGFVLLMGDAYTTVGQGTWALQSVGATSSYNFHISNNATSANGDNLTFDISLPSGTYTVFLLATEATNRAIHKIDIDGTTVHTADCYGSFGRHESSTSGINVTTGGAKTITLKADGKNGSSSSYFVSFGHIIFVRTGVAT